MDDVVEVTAQPRSRGRLYATGLVAAGVVGGVVLAGLNVASAQTSPTPTPAPGSAAPARPGHRFGGHGLKGGGLGGALHGEFTTRAPGGGYQVLATQVGEATAVSATSITVKSADGYSRTYTVGDDTLVNAGNDGIADVKSGNQVRVLAVVKDGTAGAVNVVDLTTVKELRGTWRPQRKPRDTAPSGTTSGTSSGAA